MKFVAILVIALFGFAQCDDTNANQFVDQLIEALKAKKNFDPMVFGEHHTNIHKQVLIIPLDAKVDMHKTTITGLSKASRQGDAAIDKNTKGAFSAKLRLGDSGVKAHSEVTVHVGPLIHPNLKVDADIGNLGISFGVTIGDDNKPAIANFHLDKFQNVKLHVHGLALLDPLVNILSDAYLKFFNEDARKMIEDMIKPVMEEELKKLMNTPQSQ